MYCGSAKWKTSDDCKTWNCLSKTNHGTVLSFKHGIIGLSLEILEKSQAPPERNLFYSFLTPLHNVFNLHPPYLIFQSLCEALPPSQPFMLVPPSIMVNSLH